MTIFAKICAMMGILLMPALVFANLQNPVQTVSFMPANGKLNIIVGTPKPQSFHVTENEYTRQVLVTLPKTDWTRVVVKDDAPQWVDNYFVDQSHPGATILVVTLKQGLSVLRSGHITEAAGQPFHIEIGPSTGVQSEWGKNAQEHWGQNISKTLIGKTEDISEDSRRIMVHNKENTVVQKNPFAYETQPPTFEKDSLFQGGTANFTSLSVGPYGGLQMGPSAGYVTMDSNNSLPTNNTSYQRNLDGFSFGGFVGYGAGLHQFVIAPEFFFNLAYQAGRMTYLGGASQSTYKDVTDFTYGLVLRVGAMIAPEALLSFRIGGVGTVLQHKAPAGQSGFNQNMAGTLYGFGLETVLGPKTSLRLDYNHIDYQHFGQTVDVGGTQTGNVRLSPHTDQILIGIAYQLNDRFGPNSPENDGVIPTGGYIGTGVTFANSAYDRSYGLLNNSAYGVKMKSSTSTPLWMVQAGYGVQYDAMYAGAEIQANLGTSFLTESLTQGGTQNGYTFQRQPSIGLYVRPGYAYGHGLLFYGKLGVIMTRFKRTFLGTPGTTLPYFSYQGSESKNMFGVGFGGGIEVFSNDHLSFRGEYMYDLFRRMTFSDAVGTETMTPSGSRFSLSVNYLFA